METLCIFKTFYMCNKFDFIFLEEALDFLKSKIEEKASSKILYNIRKAQDDHDPRLFKKLNSTIWEFRTNYLNNQYRLFAFWDKTPAGYTLVVCTHGIIKKTDKVSKNDLERAENIRRKYFDIQKK